MKYASERGNGCRDVSGKSPSRFQRLEAHGGSGATLGGNHPMARYCLKIVRLQEKDGRLNDRLWSEARSVSLYTSVARNIPGCAVCPLPASYWIHEKDPLYEKYPRTRMSEKHPRALIDHLSLFDVAPEQLESLGVDDPAAYWFVPPPLLKQIYDGRKSARLLLTYPVLRGESSLHDAPLKSPLEIRRMVYHILSAILVLYRNGLAHGDVKPANIMLMRPFGFDYGFNYSYFLTDIGSVHSGDQPSDSFTEGFFNTGVFEKWKKEPDRGKQNREFIGEGGFEPDTKLSESALNKLLRRTLMDGYALAVTVWSMAKGREPASPLFNRDLVDDKWHCNTITDVFNRLCDVRNLTIAEMQKIADRLKAEFPCRFDKSAYIKTYGRESEVEFDVGQTDKVNGKEVIEYGKLSEQLNFSGKYNPMVRFYGERKTDNLPPYDVECGLPREVVMQPIIETYSNGGLFVNDIYYAPDDAAPGRPLVDFENYLPCTLGRLLENGTLTEEDVTELSALGRRIDNDRKQKRANWKNFFMPIPYPRDIVKVGGSWMIQPFFLGLNVFPEISFEEYFKMLCRRDNMLTFENWVSLLEYDRSAGILLELMPKGKVRWFARQLSAAAGEDSESASKAEKSSINHCRKLRDALRKTEKFERYLQEE